MKTNFSHIGIYAQQVLGRSRSARVSGIASRGIYLQPADDWTLYISQEKFRGPLTLNLEESSVLKNIKAGNSVQFNSGEITFPDQKISFSLNDSKIWNSPLPVDNPGQFPQGVDAALSLAQKSASGNPYFPLLFDNPGKIPGAAVIGERIQNLQDALKTGVTKNVAEAAIKLLGLGPGLTPLGDDFLLGVLLTFNRWGHVLIPTQPEIRKDGPPAQRAAGQSNHATQIINDLNQIILENTRLKTTQISASLLTCAVEGAADERLLKVLDGFFSDLDITKKDLKNILRWGSSSGIAVLAGIFSVLKTKDTVP